MPNKLTDNDIKKALGEVIKLALCDGDLQRSSTISKTLDYINRLEAENKVLRTAVEQHHLIRKNDKSPLSLLTAEIKADAYKEVFEKISDKSCVQEIKKGLFCNVVTLHDINTLKKEMVGEDK